MLITYSQNTNHFVNVNIINGLISFSLPPSIFQNPEVFKFNYECVGFAMNT